MLGIATSPVEIVQVSRFGIWLAIDEEEYFLDRERYPWFADATINQICAVERPSVEHLYWPELDVDLDLDSLRNPENYPLAAK
jgi:hypothetical protein